MEAFLPDTVKAILLGLLAIAFALARLARALPHVAWLQVFSTPGHSNGRGAKGKTAAIREPAGWSGDRCCRRRVAAPVFRLNDHVIQRTQDNTHDHRDCLFGLVHRPWDLDLRAESLATPDRHERDNWPRLRHRDGEQLSDRDH
ncbi:MAG TPA: hypothetical protein VHD88_03550 [Pyrinomonadaceae bacterium]|nr:hypothetical protein [Pyrinomonadaceae bacterium]